MFLLNILAEAMVPYSHVATVVVALAASIVFLVGWIRHLYNQKTEEQAEERHLTAERRKEDLLLIERVITVTERNSAALSSLTAEFKQFVLRNDGGSHGS